MDRERVLTVSGAFVAVVMAGLLAYTTVNGRTLGPPRFHPRAGTDLLEHELRALVVDQVAYHERQRRFTANLAELDFAPYDPGTIVKIVAADSEGWTAVAVSYESRMACVLSVGKGRAAGASTESYFASYEVTFDSVATCTVADTSVHHEEILEVPDSLEGPEGAPVRLDPSHVPGAPSRRPR
jgi:hypothetical protein